VEKKQFSTIAQFPTIITTELSLSKEAHATFLPAAPAATAVAIPAALPISSEIT
jgi:hypothetical protein